MNAITQSVATAGQIKQINRFGSDAIEKVLAELGLDNPGAQRVIEHGDKFAEAIRSAAIASLKDLSVSENESEDVVVPWTVDDEGNIHFTLTSNGFTREQWEPYLERRYLRIGDRARQVLRCASEAPTDGVTYNIVVRPGKSISEGGRITEKIRAAADKKGWLKPHWEVACLIRVAFTDAQLEQMGLLYIATMHEPIDSDGVSRLLRSGRGGVGRWLYACYGRPNDCWDGNGGFAFDESRGSEC